MLIKFSICIAAYKQNNEYFKECLDSVFSQTFRNYEVVICQQGNDDLGWVKTQYPDVNIVIRDKPSLYGTRLAMLKEAKGDYVWFIDSDDKIASETALEELATAIEENGNPDLVIFDNGQSATIPLPSSKEELLECLLSRDSINSIWAKVFRRPVEANFPDFDIYQSEDKVISLCLANEAQSVLPIQRQLYWYRPNESSGTKSFNPKRIEDRAIVSLWIENTFANHEERFLGYAWVLYDYFCIFLQGRSSKDLTSAVLANINSMGSVTSLFSLIKKNWSKVISQTSFFKRIVYKAIVQRRNTLLLLILDGVLALKPP